ncbi:hypothetical protein KSZ_29310 [Dictyobacter formicarum]|uniref:Uncharacterized protein n=1 Tax=Dictyobacter formicarum TaxID=2778368 RepID=A0ABQ3VFZ3_9CHLR|nr:hypothetical protein KSZ_29310 [Dictyobacter formicarum]
MEVERVAALALVVIGPTSRTIKGRIQQTLLKHDDKSAFVLISNKRFLLKHPTSVLHKIFIRSVV